MANISIVVPFFNEAEVLPQFHERLSATLNSLELNSEILYVDDGSSDGGVDILERLRRQDPRVAVLSLSRNFGKEIALTAGLDHAQGEAVIIIDADLQDPPELIPTLIERWRKGYDVVYAQRTERQGEGVVKLATASLFYKLMRRTGPVEVPEQAGDFRLLSRRAVDALRSLREQHRFMKGLFSWIGYAQCAVPYVRDPRSAGTTKWNYWRLWNFAIEGITSFTIMPLKIATYLGSLIAFFAFLFALFIIYKTIFFGDPVAGYPSMMVVVLFLGGAQLVFIGILGEYLGRVFDETKQRPLYLVDRYLASGCGEADGQPAGKA